MTSVSAPSPVRYLTTPLSPPGPLLSSWLRKHLGWTWGLNWIWPQPRDSCQQRWGPQASFKLLPICFLLKVTSELQRDDIKNALFQFVYYPKFADQQSISQLCILYLNQIVCNLLLLPALHTIFKVPYLYPFQIYIPSIFFLLFILSWPDCFHVTSLLNTIYHFQLSSTERMRISVEVRINQVTLCKDKRLHYK